MNYTQPARQMAGCIVAVIAIGIFVALTVAGHFLADRPPEKGFERGSFAVVRICVQDEGPWGCFEHLETWIPRAEEAQGTASNDFRSPYVKSFLKELMQIAPAKVLLDHCPLARKDECAARMIAFGYDRSATMEEPIR